MKGLFPIFAAICVSIGSAQTARADYTLPFEGVFSSIANYFVTSPPAQSAPSISVDEVPSPMASDIDQIYFQARLDGLFCKRFIRERTFRDCGSCCEKQYADLLGHDGLAKYQTDLKAYYLKSCLRNCQVR